MTAGLVAVRVPAAEVAVGDYLDRRSRVSTVMIRKGTLYCATRVRGARSGSLATFPADSTVTVYRQEQPS